MDLAPLWLTISKDGNTAAAVGAFLGGQYIMTTTGWEAAKFDLLAGLLRRR